MTRPGATGTRRTFSSRRRSAAVGDHVRDGVDQRQVREGLGEVAEVATARGVELLGVETERRGEASSRSQRTRARSRSPISDSAETIQNEQIRKVPSSPLRPSSVSSTR